MCSADHELMFYVPVVFFLQVIHTPLLSAVMQCSRPATLLAEAQPALRRRASAHTLLGLRQRCRGLSSSSSSLWEV